jgi:DNA polymerase III epsilon subunit-like protein
MVAGAPHFHEVAARGVEAIDGRVFVAHNAAFDWRFLSHEMQQATGTSPSGAAALHRAPGAQAPPRAAVARSWTRWRYYFGVEIENRHRALDDAVATARC